MSPKKKNAAKAAFWGNFGQKLNLNYLVQLPGQMKIFESTKYFDKSWLSKLCLNESVGL